MNKRETRKMRESWRMALLDGRVVRHYSRADGVPTLTSFPMREDLDAWLAAAHPSIRAERVSIMAADGGKGGAS